MYTLLLMSIILYLSLSRHSIPGMFKNEHRISSKQSEQAWDHFVRGGPTKVRQTSLTGCNCADVLILESADW